MPSCNIEWYMEVCSIFSSLFYLIVSIRSFLIIPFFLTSEFCNYKKLFCYTYAILIHNWIVQPTLAKLLAIFLLFRFCLSQAKRDATMEQTLFRNCFQIFIPQQFLKISFLLLIFEGTDYGRPMKSFIYQNPKLLCLGIRSIFGQFISTHFATVSPLSMFYINQLLFLKKPKPLYPHPKYLFGIGIWIWAA